MAEAGASELSLEALSIVTPAVWHHSFESGFTQVNTMYLCTRPVRGCIGCLYVGTKRETEALVLWVISS